MAAAGVYRLQTEFGGGKTHTLLAAYHLFRDPQRVAGTAFVSELAEQAGPSSFPKANGRRARRRGALRRGARSGHR